MTRRRLTAGMGILALMISTIVIYALKNMFDISTAYLVFVSFILGHVLSVSLIRTDELDKAVIFFLGLTAVGGMLTFFNLFLTAIVESFTFLFAGITLSVCLRGVWELFKER